MEFQITEAVELIKTLAETENLTLRDALQVFVIESGLDVEYASQLKGALFEAYSLDDMASDSLTKALYSVFVSGESAEDIQEVDTKETQEGTKYKIRVKDRQSGSSYVRYATREKIAELRANPNISSVELTDHGTTGEDDGGEKTAAAKGGGTDHDGDGKVESSSKEHAGVVHNAIQRKKGGTPDGQDTRKEEVEVEEGIDFKGARREDERREKIQKEKDKKSPSSKDRRLAMGKFRPGASKEERAEGGRDAMREKGTSPTKNGKKMFEAYLELRAAKLAERFEVTDADEKNNTEAYKRFKAGNPAYTRADAKKKVETKEEWKPDPKEKRAKKSAKIARDEAIESGKRDRDRDDDKVKDLYKRRMAVDFKKKKSSIGEDLVAEADLVDAGRKSQGQRDKKKLSGAGVDNSTNVKLMPKLGESVVTGIEVSPSEKRVAGLVRNPSLSYGIVAELAERMGLGLVSEECCPDCGTPECTCEGKKEEKPKKRKPKTKLDEAGMPILEYSENNARPGPSPEMINPGKDPEGDVGHMNPKGKPKRYKNKGEAPGDRRPNDPSGPDLPNEKGTVPNGAGV